MTLRIAGMLLAAVLPLMAEIETGTLPRQWTSSGEHCMEMQEFYIHEYNPDFYILRQSACSDYEKPFLYLFFGKEKALLWDTGSRNARTRESVDRLIERWLKVRQRTAIPLVVVHSHRHGDHIAGDAQFAGRPETTLVKPNAAAVKEFFGFTKWPEEVRTFDLGDRVMDIVPIPGHTDDSIALYDRRTGVLLTGDTVYPGRLYVENFSDFQKSIHRLAEWTNGKPVAHVLGNHIEQTRTPFVDYPVGKMYQPDEHSLELGVGNILELDRVLGAMTGPAWVPLRDLTIAPRGAAGAPDLRGVRERTEAADREKLWKK